MHPKKTNNKKIVFEFVEFIPETLNEDVLYISIPYATCAHLCFCGCRSEVNTPLSPTDWKLTFDGISVSLDPSIGNWSFKCKSHYWIENNEVLWATTWSNERINHGRNYDRIKKEKFYKKDEFSDNQDVYRDKSTSWLKRLFKK